MEEIVINTNDMPCIEAPKGLLTKEQILKKYLPQRETFEVNYHGGKDVVKYSAEVSRREDGLPLYFVPGSCIWINPPTSKSSSSV